MESLSTALVAACCRRVAIERMNTRSRAQRVHADAVAEQRAARLRRRVGSTASDGDAHLGKRVQESQQQLVDDARLAGAAGAGDADDRDARAPSRPRLRAARPARLRRTCSCSIADSARPIAISSSTSRCRSRRASRGDVARALGRYRACARRRLRSCRQAEAHPVVRGGRCARRRKPRARRSPPAVIVPPPPPKTRMWPAPRSRSMSIM